MNVDDSQVTVLKNALKITNIINQHLVSGCPHCTELFKEIEFE